MPSSSTINEGSVASSGGDIVTLQELYNELVLSSPTAAETLVCIAAITRAEGAVKRHLKYDPVQRRRTEFYPMQDFSLASRAAVWEVSDTEAYQRRLSEASTDELQVQHIPIRSYPAIDLRLDYDGRSGTRSGSFAASTQQTEGTDFHPNYDGRDSDGYSVCRDGIIRAQGTWPLTAGCVRITYTAGYSSSEFRGGDSLVDASSVWDAAMCEAVRRAKKAFAQQKHTQGWVAGIITSERLGDYSYTLDSSTVSQLVGGSFSISDESKELLSDFVNYGWVLGG